MDIEHQFTCDPKDEIARACQSWIWKDRTLNPKCRVWTYQTRIWRRKKRRNLDLKHKYTCYNAKSYYLVFLINNGVSQIHGADGCEHRRLEKANIGIHFGRNFLVNTVVFGVIFTIRTHFTNSFLVWYLNNTLRSIFPFTRNKLILFYLVWIG